jgi:mono/diheme cytochrome c family protein
MISQQPTLLALWARLGSSRCADTGAKAFLAEGSHARIPAVWFALAMLVFGTVLSGCGSATSPPFVMDLNGRDVNAYRITGDEKDEAALEDKERVVEQVQNMETSLFAAFGTPDDPYVLDEQAMGLDLRKIRMAAGPAASNSEGENQGLYRRHCAHCHGVTGGGDGPTARFLVPYPRDYRRGIFKFTSTAPGYPPTKEDLKRVLVDGVPGTSMPSFKLLADDELESLVEYVKYLSLRGQTEGMMFLMIDDEEDIPVDGAGLLDVISGISQRWQQASENVVIPEPTTVTLSSSDEELLASIDRGREVFRDAKKAQCTKCHGPTGLGDGGEKLYDIWNQDKNAENADEYTLPKQELKPRDLTLAIYRGGNRPVDLYRRLFAGIKGTPMPSMGNVLQPEQMWDVINYVRYLPYPESLEALRNRVHRQQQADANAAPRDDLSLIEVKPAPTR